MTIFKEENRYPEKGDKLFMEEGSSNEIAWLHKAFQEFGAYADSYQAGAMNLIDIALKKSETKDFLVYPTIFLIRHYFELRLKELVQGLNFCITQKKEFPAHHDLQTLWSDFKKLYKKIREEDTKNRFPIIDDLIKEICSVDPKSMSFRYPVDKEGIGTQKLEYVNLSNLRKIFVRVCFVFDDIALQISHYAEMTNDMLSDLYSDYY